MLPALRIQNLQKVYASGVVALSGIDLEIAEGDFFGLLGPNGAGKSTVISILCSLVRKTSGKVFLFDCDIDADFAKARKLIGVVPQEFNFPQFEKVAEILVSQAGYYGIPADVAQQRVEKYLRRLELWDKRDEISRNLSGGMKRRLMIARALIHEPKLLILDEPTAGVDIEIRRSMWEFLKELNAAGTTIILTTHYLEEAENLCRNLAVIEQGRIIINSSMPDFISQLDTETFILDLGKPLTNVLDGFVTTVLNEFTVEVILHKHQTLNDVFSQLTRLGVPVLSLRNKANRLEQLMMKLLDDRKLDDRQLAP